MAPRGGGQRGDHRGLQPAEREVDPSPGIGLGKATAPGSPWSAAARLPAPPGSRARETGRPCRRPHPLRRRGSPRGAVVTRPATSTAGCGPGHSSTATGTRDRGARGGSEEMALEMVHPDQRTPGQRRAGSATPTRRAPISPVPR